MAFTTITSITALIGWPSLSLAELNRISEHLKVFQYDGLFSPQYSDSNLASFVLVRHQMVEAFIVVGNFQSTSIKGHQSSSTEQ